MSNRRSHTQRTKKLSFTEKLEQINTKDYMNSKVDDVSAAAAAASTRLFELDSKFGKYTRLSVIRSNRTTLGLF